MLSRQKPIDILKLLRIVPELNEKLKKGDNGFILISPAIYGIFF